MLLDSVSTPLCLHTYKKDFLSSSISFTSLFIVVTTLILLVTLITLKPLATLIPPLLYSLTSSASLCITVTAASDSSASFSRTYKYSANMGKNNTKISKTIQSYMNKFKTVQNNTQTVCKTIQKLCKQA